MFTYFADAPTFVHCATGLVHPVAQEGDYLTLERAYLEDRTGPAEPLLVTLDATIETRPQMEGPDRLSVIVEAFDATWPGETCVRATAAPRLAGTVWRIRSIDEVSLAWSPPGREPFILLNTEDARVNASGAGIATGLSAGICATVQAAQEKGTMAAEQVDQVLASAASDLGSASAVEDAEMVGSAARCEDVMAKLTAAAE